MNEKDELLQVYNESGDIIEPLPRSVVHQKPVEYWHGVVNVWLVNRDLQLMVSKRSESVGGNPGKWQTYFGGHVPAGLSHSETAVKELQEEIGLTIEPDKLHLIEKGQFSNEDHLHFYESYAYLYNGSPDDLTFSDGEIVQAKWFSIDDYWRAKTAYPEQWCNACNEENQKRIKEWLLGLNN